MKRFCKRFLSTLNMALVLRLSGSVALRADETRIYLANDDHTDYMWTANADTYNAVFVDMLDYYLNLADVTQNNPLAFQNRFNADGSYWLWNHERQKSPAASG